MSVLSNGIFGLIIFILICYILGVFHVINEGIFNLGHIGIYTRGGALLQGYTDPGLHTMIPIITRVHQVQITVQTDRVTNIPCGTASGVQIYFDSIEVVNRLRKQQAWQTIKDYTVDYDKTWIFDKIHHEINQFCSKHSFTEIFITKFDQLDEELKDLLQKGCEQYAPGIEIISVRVTKPRVPRDIEQKYINTEAERTKLLISRERQKLEEHESETHKILQKIEAETETEISKLNQQEELIYREGQVKISEINNQINLIREKAFAEAQHYQDSKEIEINQKKLTNEVLKEQAYENLKNIKKVYYGDSIKAYLDENMKIFEN